MRICTFNVENLFSRPVVFGMRDQKKAKRITLNIAEFNGFLSQKSYAANNDRIEELYDVIKSYININIRSSVIGRRLFKNGKLRASGRGDWDGFVDLRRKRFNEKQIKFTGKVIKEVNADVQCLVEVESSSTLQRFNADVLRNRFPDRIVIDGNDPRGIDIALATKKQFPMQLARTNIFAEDGQGTIFSRDCLEVELETKNGNRLFVLVNHFKAKDRNPRKSDQKRKRQSIEVSRILRERYDLDRDYVVVAGDLNDEPNSAPLAPLFATPKLYNVMDEANHPSDDRWTYYYGREKSYNIIDYLFVSKALKPHVREVGFERRGMHNLERLTNGIQKPFPGIDTWRDAASDHAAAWADLDI